MTTASTPFALVVVLLATSHCLSIPCGSVYVVENNWTNFPPPSVIETEDFTWVDFRNEDGNKVESGISNGIGGNWKKEMGKR
jgi:hypothetical protein